ncbi:MAG: molecular chaperone DnaJ, partial [Arthrobacter sp.]|nr:molecular chaperone DnaJ [Arthrobacter sp.]
MTTSPDYYDTLRVQPHATQQEISRAYRALMRSHHPDVDGGTSPEGVLL